MNDYKEICDNLRMASRGETDIEFEAALWICNKGNEIADIIEHLAKDNNLLKKERDKWRKTVVEQDCSRCWKEWR